MKYSLKYKKKELPPHNSMDGSYWHNDEQKKQDSEDSAACGATYGNFKYKWNCV